MMKKIISILLLLSVIFTFCSCGDKSGGDTTSTNTDEYVLPTEIVNADISLPYTSAEGFDPYNIKSSTNKAIADILYESLYLPTDNGEGEPFLASDGKKDGKKVTVTIKKGVKFSDGTEMTTTHIKKSLEKAKNNSYYSPSLSNIASVKIIDDYTLIFEFYNQNIFLLNTLVFPIIKESDGKIFGSGKYKLQYLDDIPYLNVNTAHRDFKPEWNKQIALYDMAGKNGPIYPFKAGDISIYQNNLSGEDYVNLSSQTFSQNSNNFVYLGINSNWAGSLTSIDWVRHAINIGLDRNMISASSFLGQTVPAITPYRNEVSQLKTEELPAINGELQKAIGILERNGYNKINSDGVRTNGSNSLRVNILVCTENPYKIGVAEAVKKSLEDMGFGVSVTQKKKAKDFKKALKGGHFDLYIGETILPLDYSLDEFFSKSGNLNYGIDSEFYSEYDVYENGQSTLMNFIESFETEVPFIPLFYRKNIISVNPNITGVDKNNIYLSISDWEKQK